MPFPSYSRQHDIELLNARRLEDPSRCLATAHSAWGLWKERAWGYTLSIINCPVALVLMLFMLPAGAADGVLSGGALVMLLIAHYGTAPIERRGRG
jgi:hypothetical protein